MCALVTEGKRDPTKACVQDLMFINGVKENSKHNNGGNCKKLSPPLELREGNKERTWKLKRIPTRLRF